MFFRIIQPLFKRMHPAEVEKKSEYLRNDNKKNDIGL